MVQRLLSAADEAATYHDTARHGFFSLLMATDARKKQDSYLLAQMPVVLSMFDHHSRDIWLSQAEFLKPNRRVVNLARIGLLFADLDTYRVPWAQGLRPTQLASAVLFHCSDQGVPPPSLLVFSGRGVQAKWLLESTLPRRVLPRWNACQRHLIDRLAGLGADPAARDASRVLRLVNTVNSKSGTVCHVIHVEQNSDGEPIRYNFEYLAKILLPVARWNGESGCKSHRWNSETACKRHFKMLPGGQTSNLHILNGRQLAWDRLEDLRTLAHLRGGVTEGERMLHLFWRLNFLLLSGATYSIQMYHEAAMLAHELDPRWNYDSAELVTLYDKAKAYKAGGKVECGGKLFAPLYTPKNDTLISLFQITDDEQRKLRTLLSRDMAAERHRKRDEVRRRAAGAIDRATYEAHALSRQKPWAALGMSRAHWYRTGKLPVRQVPAYY